MFSQFQRILYAYAKISDRVFDLVVAQQNLDRVDVSGCLVDDCCVLPSKRMRAIEFTSQSNCSHSFIDQANLLARTPAIRMVNSTWKGKIIVDSAAAFEPCKQTGMHIWRIFELNGMAELDFDEIAAPSLAVDRRIKQCLIFHASFMIKEETDRPNLMLFQWVLNADLLANIPRSHNPKVAHFKVVNGEVHKKCELRTAKRLAAHSNGQQQS